MALKFITGLASADHLQGVAQRVLELKNENRYKHIYYIVPNHIKFQSEIQLLSKISGVDNKLKAESQVQVLSISRLAWFYLKDSNIYQYPRLTTSSTSMILYKIIKEHIDELTLFKDIDNQFGLVSKIASQLTSFKRGNISPDNLEELSNRFSEQTDISIDLKAKTHDLNIIYAAFENEVQSRFIDNSDILRNLNEVLTDSELVDDAFVFSGFSSFSAEELRLVETLIRSNASITIDLVTDDLTANIDVNDFFYETKKLAQQLKEQAEDNQIELKPEVKLQQVRVEEDLLALEKYWIESSGSGGRFGSNNYSLSHIDIKQMNSRFSEVESILTEMRQKMTKNSKLKFSDFAILTSQLSDYDMVIRPLFEQFKTPYFYDLQIMMKDHSFVEFLRALFDVKTSYFQYENVMRLLKLGYLIPDDVDRRDFLDALDITENYVIKEGVLGRDWTSKHRWKITPTFGNDGVLSEVDKAKESQVNLVKDFVASTLVPFFKSLDEAITGRDAVSKVYDFLIQQKIDVKIKREISNLTEVGKLSSAAEMSQTWQMLMQLLDEFVDVLGNSEFKLEDFIGLIEVGFSSAQFSQVPSTLDQVLISESGMVQMADKKFVYIIGADDQKLPAQPDDNSFFDVDGQTEIERNLEDDQYLSTSLQRQLKEQPFLNYLNFLMGSDELHFSYSTSDHAGSSHELSPYVKRIAEYFNINIEQVESRPSVGETKINRFVGSKRNTLSHLVQYARDLKRSGQNESVEEWQYIYSILNNSQYGTLANQLLESLNYKNIPMRLRPEIVQGLYGNTILASVSKLEKFFQNEYAYFLEFGLKLRERETANLTSADTGVYFHAAFDTLIKEITDKKIDFKNLTSNEIKNLQQTVIQKLEADNQFRTFTRTNRLQYLRGELNNTIKEMTRAVLTQMMRTKMRPIVSEQMFGQIESNNSGLPPLVFGISDTQKVQVRGKIDRIDRIDVNKDTYLGIVDYKSSANKAKFSFKEAYYGLTMQMLLYLDVVRRNSSMILPGQQVGISDALYMHIQNPLLRAKDKKITTLEEEKINQLVFSEYGLKGIILDDLDLLEEIDPSIGEGHLSSEIFPIKLTKAGAPNKNAEAITSEEDIDRLIRNAEKRVIEAGKRIFSGEVNLNPVRFGDKNTALSYTPYKDIMQFDAMLPENSYRDIPNMSKKDVLNKLKDEEDE